jgi:allantoate deiminase/N-carbamoyl-L-amino-acid hydrolase
MNFQLAGVPTGMVFVPSVDGISHNPREETPGTAIRDATATLGEALTAIE